MSEKESVEQLARRISANEVGGYNIQDDTYRVSRAINDFLRSHNIDPATMKPIATPAPGDERREVATSATVNSTDGIVWSNETREAQRAADAIAAIQVLPKLYGWKLTLSDSFGKPKAMYERFTDRARKVMQLANQEAQRFNHEYISPGHIVIALVKEGSGLGGQALAELGVDVKKARLALEKIEKPGPDMVTIGKLPQTPRAKLVMETAIAEAKALLHDYVGTEHMALALAAVVEGPHVEMLNALGVPQPAIRETVQRYFKEIEDEARKQLQPYTPTAQQPEVSVVERDRELALWIKQFAFPFIGDPKRWSTYTEFKQGIERRLTDHLATERAEAEGFRKTANDVLNRLHREIDEAAVRHLETQQKLAEAEGRIKDLGHFLGNVYIEVNRCSEVLDEVAGSIDLRLNPPPSNAE